MMSPKPQLVRCPATTMRSRRDLETDRLELRILRAYDNLPQFHGPVLVAGHCDDAFRAALEDEIAETNLAIFDLEAWLGHMIAARGTDSQRREWTRLMESLDDYEGYGLPSDIGDVLASPAQEIEVYRDLSSVDLADLTISDDEDDEDAV